MSEVHIILLLCLVVAAVLSDLGTGRIPNGIIAAGLGCGGLYQVFTNGAAGTILYLGGVILPILIFGVFYYFRMVGAGDIKLLCMAGGFFGPSGCFFCVKWSVFFGGLISLAIMLRRRNIEERLAFFAEFVSRYSRERKWRSYMGDTKENARFCFSVPILLGVLCRIICYMRR